MPDLSWQLLKGAGFDQVSRMVRLVVWWFRLLARPSRLVARSFRHVAESRAESCQVRETRSGKRRSYLQQAVAFAWARITARAVLVSVDSGRLLVKGRCESS